jgi:hypothetical protein
MEKGMYRVFNAAAVMALVSVVLMIISLVLSVMYDNRFSLIGIGFGCVSLGLVVFINFFHKLFD